MALRISDEDYEKANQYPNPGKIDDDEKFNDLKQAEKSGNTEADEGLNDKENDGEDSLKGAEESPNGDWANNVSGKNSGGQGSKNKIKTGGKLGFLKKKGPLTTIILTVVGGGMGISALLSPGLLLVHLKETFFEKLNNAGPALQIRTNKMLFKKFNAVRYSFSESSDGKCNIKCKFNTMSDTMKKNLEAKGYKVEVDETKGVKGLFGTRSVVKSIILPEEIGGGKISNSKEFNDAMKDNKIASNFKKVFNSKTAYFLNSKFGLILKEKLGINKLNVFKNITKDKTGTMKDAVIKKMRDALKLPELDSKIKTLADKIKDTSGYKTAEAKMKAGQEKFSSAASWVGMICAAYNFNRVITVSVKAAKIASFVAFAMLFLNVADQIKAGDADPDVVSALGDQLTAQDSNSKTATDSLGYRNISYGDTGNLSDEQKAYSASGSGNLFGITSTLMAAVFGTNIALSVFQKFCQAVNSTWSTAVECIAVAVETFGIGCIAKELIKGIALSAAIGTALGAVLNIIVKNELPLIDENTIGENLGNTISTGTAQILGVTATSYGLKAGSLAEVKQYAIDTAQIRKQERDIAYYEASKTPFDIYNKYSFLGSIVNSSGLLNIFNSGSITSTLSNIYSILPKSLASIDSLALAQDDYIAQRFSGCTDPNITDAGIGIATDSLCNPSFIMDTQSLNLDSNDVVDFMVNNNFIKDEDGSLIVDGSTGYILGDPANSYTKKTDYENYLDNCANRTIPVGESSNSVESEYFYWEVGLNCTNPTDETIKNELPYFQSYTMDKSINDTMDETNTTAINDNNFSDSISFYDSSLNDHNIASSQIDNIYANILTSDVNIFTSETETAIKPTSTTIELNNKTQPIITNAQNTNICNPTSISNRITDFNYLCMQPYLNKEYVGV
jgi:hypothetical protein